MSKSTSLAASASADPGIEPDVPTAAEIVIDSNMVNFHGEATDENTFLPRAVMIQVAASLSNFGTKDDLVYGGILPLQVTNANIVAGHQEEVCKLLVPFTDVTATNKDWHIISTLKSTCYSYFKVTHPKDDDETSMGTVEHRYTTFLGAAGDNLINHFTEYILKATNCKYDINRYNLVRYRTNQWVKMGHGAIVGLVQELSATSDNLRDALDCIGDVDTPKLAVSLLPYLLPDANIGFVYEGDSYEIPSGSVEWEEFDVDCDIHADEMERVLEAQSKKLKARMKRAKKRSEREVAEYAQKRAGAAGKKVNNGETNNTSLSVVADNTPAVPTMDNAPISNNVTEVPRPRDDATAAADNNTAVPTVDNGPTSNNVTHMPKDNAMIAGQVATQENHPNVLTEPWIEASTEGPLPMLQVSDNANHQNNGAVLESKEGSYENVEHIAQKTTETFPMNTRKPEQELIKDIKEFAAKNFFKARIDGRQGMVCSRSATTSSRKKQSGTIVCQRAETSIVSNCQWGVGWSKKKEFFPNVCITSVNPYHNHDCNIGAAAVSHRKSGTSTSQAITTITQVLAPFILSKRPVPCNIIRHTIKPYVSRDIFLDTQTIANMMRSAKVEIERGNYTIPPIINSDGMKAFTSSDITSATCGSVLKDLIANCDGSTTWIVTKLMIRLAENDPFFDFRIHYDDHDECDVVTWQVGESRGGLQRYHSHIFLDARKSENMNSINMRYLSIICVDANHSLLPACESFVFEEEHESYRHAITFMLEMTPTVTADMIKFGVGDLFLTPEVVQQWLPNIVWWADPYHFCSKKNKTSVLALEFGPSIWKKVCDHFIAAQNAKSEQDCLKHLSDAILAVSGNQSAINKINKWQKDRHKWALYIRNGHPGHFNIKASSYAESNHSHMRAIAGDDAKRSIEQNIVDVMERTDHLFKGKQIAKDKYATEAAGDLQRIKDATERKHLTRPRMELDNLPYTWFREEYYQYMQYNVLRCMECEVPGARVCHTSNSNDGYFIPDDDVEIMAYGQCPCVDAIAMNNCCRHIQAKRISEGKDPFCKEIIDKRHFFLAKNPKVEAVKVENLLEYPIFPKDNTAKATTNVVIKKNSSTLSQKQLISNAFVFASPSQLVAKGSTGAPDISSLSFDDIYTRKKPKQVGYKTLQEAGTNLASAASSSGLEVQNAVLTMMVNMTSIISNGEYRDERAKRYEGTPMEMFVQHMQRLVRPNDGQLVIGGPKLKAGVTNTSSSGPHRTYRLGSTKSINTTITKRRSCTFCGGSGMGTDFHTSRASCPVMSAYGTAVDVHKVKPAAVARDLDSIINGITALGGSVCQFEDVSTFGNMDGRRYIDDELPSGTRRLQIKGYVIINDTNYFMCTCIDSLGKCVNQEQGVDMVSFNDVFIEQKVVTLSLNKLDFVFYLPVRNDAPNVVTQQIDASAPGKKRGIDNCNDNDDISKKQDSTSKRARICEESGRDDCGDTSENDGGRGKRSRRPTNKAIEAKTDNGTGSWICK